MNDEVIDLKCRSMRDNLLFFGIPEGSTPAPTDIQSDNTQGTPTHTTYAAAAASVSFSSSSHTDEDCKSKVISFCEKVLHMSNPADNIHIERAHRIGRYISGKTRPVVAKLNSDSKTLIKNATKSVNLKNSSYNIADQFPQEVKERRRQLIPIMLDARRHGKRAVL